MAPDVVEQALPSMDPIQLAFPLPRALETKVHVHLTINSSSLLLFLTTVSGGDISSTTPLGSFVYALPDRVHPGQVISTPLFTQEFTIEFTTRMAKLLAKKTGKPVYVGSSMSFASAGMGGTVEEEIEGFKRVVEIVMAEITKRGSHGHLNGSIG